MHPDPNLRLYRLTNVNELHNGLRYHDGIMIDPIPFNPTGSCSTGGMYFFDESQLHLYDKYIENAHWIREVNLLPDSQVYNETDKYKTDKFLLKPRKRFDLNDLLDYINPHCLNKKKLREVMILAANKGYEQVIKGLLNYGIDIHENNDQALRCASRYGHSSVVNLLLKAGANIHANRDEALRYASKNGHTAVVELLLKAEANFHANNDEALLAASRNGHSSVVNLLLQAGSYVLSIRNEALYRCTKYSSVYRQLIQAGAIKDAWF